MRVSTHPRNSFRAYFMAVGGFAVVVISVLVIWAGSVEVVAGNQTTGYADFAIGLGLFGGAMSIIFFASSLRMTDRLESLLGGIKEDMADLQKARCKNCGSLISSDLIFCNKCGAPIIKI